MTIPESLAAIAQARPDLVTRAGEMWHVTWPVGVPPPFTLDSCYVKAHLLLWAYETAARKGLDFAVAQVGGEYAGVCGPHRSEGHADPTAAALAALAAALSADLPEPAAATQKGRSRGTGEATKREGQ